MNVPSVVSFALALSIAPASRAAESAAPVVDDAFWRTWGDGQGEIATYRGTRERYGEMRETEVVVITVTEDFSASKRVKADPGKNPTSDVFPVIKTNVNERFTTGVYPYALMTSSFVSLSSKAGVPVGHPAKISFGAQEWCGHVYHQLLFDERRAREASHSYFDGEQDRLATLPTPSEVSLVEDALLLWARGLASPVMQPGETREVAFLPSLERARLTHQPLAWTRAKLTVSKGTTTEMTPLGAHDVRIFTVVVDGGRTVRLAVEPSGARRVVRIEDDGKQTGGMRSLSLVAVERMPYWKKNRNADRPLRKTLGLDDGARR